MLFFVLLRLQHWNIEDGSGGYYYYSYHDEISWIVGLLGLAWLTWFLVTRYIRARSVRRPPGRTNHRQIKQLSRIKSELSSRYLRPGFSRTIHAMGIGQLPNDEYCIQVFITDANEELWPGAGIAQLPVSYRGIPIVPIEMPPAIFLSDAGSSSTPPPERYPNGIRERQEVIVGGISGANTNLIGQSGTIGYFCTRKSKLPRRKETHLLSNSHVFADLRKAKVDDSDLIMQPSPGEPGSTRPIGALVNYSTLKFDGDINEPNHIDAAIAKLWGPQRHAPVIPLIGPVKGYVEKMDIRIGEAARKFGRTTGYTEGHVFSTHLDIWIQYDRTGQSAFFQNQFLIEPTLPGFAKFVAKGDSGSLVVDAGQHAIGLIFGGMAELPEALKEPPKVAPNPVDNPVPSDLKRIESYGVANPISEVLDRLKIDLLV